MILDPTEVARRAESLRDENWRFRSYLKGMCAWSDRKLNNLTAELGREAAAKINCLDCGACCRGIYVPLTDEEVDRLATHKRLPVLQFRADHVRASDHDPQVLDAHPCPFQEGNRCTVHDARPEPCRDYPYLDGDVRSRMLMILERAETCPIVFEQLERLKQATGFRRRR